MTMTAWKQYSGYEACYCYEDGARCYQVFFRRVGHHFADRIGLIGHADMAADELQALMDVRVNEYMTAHNLKS